MTTYRVTLQFEKDGPVVTGDWTVEDAARRTYRKWVGLYGSDPTVRIRLTVQTGDEVTELKSWPPASEAADSSDLDEGWP